MRRAALHQQAAACCCLPIRAHTAIERCICLVCTCGHAWAQQKTHKSSMIYNSLAAGARRSSPIVSSSMLVPSSLHACASVSCGGNLRAMTHGTPQSPRLWRAPHPQVILKHDAAAQAVVGAIHGVPPFFLVDTCILIPPLLQFRGSAAARATRGWRRAHAPKSTTPEVRHDGTRHRLAPCFWPAPRCQRRTLAANLFP